MKTITTIVGHIYVRGDYLIAPVSKKFIGVRSNGFVYRHRQMVTNPHESFCFDTEYARIKIGDSEVETFHSTRDPEVTRELDEDDYDLQDTANILRGYLFNCVCY